MIKVSLLWLLSTQLFTLGSNACTSGFPERDRLVSRIFSQTGPSTRLIPEMRFLCNGTIVGYTVAMKPARGTEHPKIQVWRDDDNAGYQRVGSEISVEQTTCMCAYGLDEVAKDVFGCDLVEGASVSVQSGDILGLELPPANNDSAVIQFAAVTRGPRNYVFRQQQLPSPVMLTNSQSTSENDELPLITVRLDTKSGHKCSEGFPDRSMIESTLLNDDGHSNVTITVLIPDMNFTCYGKVAGFTFAGINRRQSGKQDPKIQIWRENICEPGVYHRIGAVIAVNTSEDGACADGLPSVAFRTYFCVLIERFQVSVQPGDILGLELPPASDDDFDISFTRGGGALTNFIFHRSLDSTVRLSERDLQDQRLPQISFSFTSDNCTSGFPDTVSSTRSRLQNTDNVTTRLFPDMRFGCRGNIVRVIVAAIGNMNGKKVPKIQIWRESETETGIYHRQESYIPLVDNSTVCVRRRRLSGRIFRCTLQEEYQVSVQPRDILGLELPLVDNDGFDIYFKGDAGQPSYVFERTLNSRTVNISKADYPSKDLPQINFVVMLDSEPNEKFESAVLPSCPDSSQVNTIVGVVVGCIVGGGAVCLFIVAVVVTLTVTMHKRKGLSLYENHPDSSSHMTTTNSHLYQGDNKDVQNLVSTNYNILFQTNYPTPVGETNDLREHSEVIGDYDEINDNEVCPSTQNHHYETYQLYKEWTQRSAHEVCGISHEYSVLEEGKQTLRETAAVFREDSNTDYWEPANNVNELYRQLCSKKYREIARDQVEIGAVELGSGQFGVVSRGVWESPRGAMDVAVKQLQPGASEEEKIKFLQEAAINGQFRHPNVVMLMGVVTVGEPTMIVLELLSNGDLRSFLLHLRERSDMDTHTVSAKVDQQLLLKFCQQIASGMSYLASKSFVHRDLAARNILVSQENICKISDFGMSRNVLDDNYYVSRGGRVPLKWTAPEAIHYKKYSTSSDVWSFGCVMYEIWSLGHKPFKDVSNVEALKMVDRGYRLPPPPGTCKEIYKIMIECWQPESGNRPTFPQLVELLSRADFELFSWDEEDLRDSDQKKVKIIGAPLETAKNLYYELQRSYASKIQ